MNNPVLHDAASVPAGLVSPASSSAGHELSDNVSREEHKSGGGKAGHNFVQYARIARLSAIGKRPVHELRHRRDGFLELAQIASLQIARYG